MYMDIILFDNLHYSSSRPFRVAAYSSPLRCSILSVFGVPEFQLCTGINPLNAELNPTCHLLVLLGAYHILHISRIRVNTMCVLAVFEEGAENVFSFTSHTHPIGTVSTARRIFLSQASRQELTCDSCEIK